MLKRTAVALVVAIAVGATAMLDAQGRRGGGPGGGAPGAGARTGTVEHIKVHGKALEGNLEGDDPDRDVTVYLPPSYAADQNRRYPVVYLLHGYTGRDDYFVSRLANLPESGDRLGAAQGFSDLIVVTPNAYTLHKGSMYSNSATTGDWESFIAQDLVAYIDGHYRTIATRMSRGLAGHSMGGYGAIRIAMKRPEVFSSLYSMSACCLDANANPRPDAPLTMVERNVTSLQRFYAIAIDIGTKDTLLAANRQLHDAMTRLQIAHSYQEYDGDHINKVGERIERNVLPFFSKNLVSPANPTSPAVKD